MPDRIETNISSVYLYSRAKFTADLTRAAPLGAAIKSRHENGVYR